MDYSYTRIEPIVKQKVVPVIIESFCLISLTTEPYPHKPRTPEHAENP